MASHSLKLQIQTRCLYELISPRNSSKSVKVGQKATVFADYGNGQKKQYNGVVTWISNRSEFTPKTILTDDERADLVYAIKIQFTNDGYAKIGMYGEVKF